MYFSLIHKKILTILQSGGWCFEPSQPQRIKSGLPFCRVYALKSIYLQNMAYVGVLKNDTLPVPNAGIIANENCCLFWSWWWWCWPVQNFIRNKLLKQHAFCKKQKQKQNLVIKLRGKKRGEGGETGTLEKIQRVSRLGSHKVSEPLKRFAFKTFLSASWRGIGYSRV